MKDKKQLQIAKSTINSIFIDYRRNNELLKYEIKQSLTNNYQTDKVQGGFIEKDKTVNKIIEHAEASTYVESVHEVLRQLPSTYQKIVLKRFSIYPPITHDNIIDSLGIDEDYDIARTTYYRWYNSAILAFYNEALIRMINIKIQK